MRLQEEPLIQGGKEPKGGHGHPWPLASARAVAASKCHSLLLSFTSYLMFASEAFACLRTALLVVIGLSTGMELRLRNDCLWCGRTAPQQLDVCRSFVVVILQFEVVFATLGQVHGMLRA